MSLLPIDPADFPDVPQTKALIALDLQNEFLTEDGALPVKQPDGMIGRIIELAQAVRGSGYGEVIWVRSQFETSRPAGEQQMMATDTPQLPGMQSSPSATTSLDADPEAFLSVDEGQEDSSKPKCVRKGTRGVDFVADIAAVRGPRDYTMTKSHYSAFETGQLLNLLRRKFAHDLYICGSLSNVSLYATALAASSHGFDITVVEDCCGFRSETRHMNTTRRLQEQTGCEISTAADVIATLRPNNSSPPRPHGPKDADRPVQIPAELIAAAMAGSSSKSIPVRARPTSSSTDPASSTHVQRRATGEREKTEEEAKVAVSSPPAPLMELPSSEKLKLNIKSPEPVSIPEHAEEAAADKASAVEPKDGPPQLKVESPLQPMVTANTEARMLEGRLDAKPDSAGAESQERHEQNPKIDPSSRTKEPTEVSDTAEFRSRAHEDPVSPSRVAEPNSGPELKEIDIPRATTKLPGLSPRQAESIVSAERLTAPTPDAVLEEARVQRPKMRNLPASLLVKTKLTQQLAKRPPAKTDSEVTGPRVESEIMAASPGKNPNESEPMCEGDTTLTRDFLPPSLVEGLFERLCEEVHFKKMMHQGGEVPRFVAVQGQIDEDGTEPVYRHPSDESPPLSPFTPAVEQIKLHVATALGHPINHVLIQCYRNGQDYISEHSDKTLDIFRWSYIANVSLGAERTMIFRQKRGEKKDSSDKVQPVTKIRIPGDLSNSQTLGEAVEEAAPSQKKPASTKRETIRCPMPHNSLIKLGLVTNEKWLHGIRADKRPQSEKSAGELAWNGTRISLTFRYIGTFLRPPSPSSTAPSDELLIWGQGAASKVPETAHPVINGQTPEAISLLKAFGRENNSPDFDWEANYGKGFNVLHMKSAPRYFGCGDDIIDGRVRVMLAECGVKHARGDIGIRSKKTGECEDGLPLARGSAPGEVVPVKFVVDDADRTTVVGDAAIMLYLDTKHPRKRGDGEIAKAFSRFYAALALGQRWTHVWTSESGGGKTQIKDAIEKLVRAELAQAEAWAAEVKPPRESTFFGIAGGPDPSIADYALWPVLHDIANAWSVDIGADVAPARTVFGCFGLVELEAYYSAFASRQSVVEVFGDSVVPELLAKDEKNAGEEEHMERHSDSPRRGMPHLEEFGEN